MLDNFPSRSLLEVLGRSFMIDSNAINFLFIGCLLNSMSSLNTGNAKFMPKEICIKLVKSDMTTHVTDPRAGYVI